jgi:hypothetical protein
LVLWSSQSLQEHKNSYFPIIYLIWSSGPQEIYKRRECHTFLLFIPFGPLVLKKFTKAEFPPFFFLCSSFGLVVLTKYTRAENVTLPYYLFLLVHWSSRNLQEQSLPYFSTAELIWSFIPFGPLVLTKFTRTEFALFFYC